MFCDKECKYKTKITKYVSMENWEYVGGSRYNHNNRKLISQYHNW